MNTPNAPSPSPRLYFLDWLRIGAFALLVAYHVGMYYVSWDWHVKSPFASGAIEPWMRLSSPWRLSLLFLVSGAATSLMLLRGRAGFLRNRSSRLLWPLLFGMAVIVPPQSYFEVVHKHGYAGSYLDFLQLYFTGYGGFCKGPGATGCLILPTWNHLWFVAYLWCYTALLWALLRLAPGLLDTLAGHAERALRGARLIVVPVVVLALLRLALAPRFPSTHALLDDWFNHATYFGVFLLGAVLARGPGWWPQFVPWRWFALLAALVGWALLVAYAAAFTPRMPPPEALRMLARVVFAGVQWCAIVALLGFAVLYLDRDHAWRRYLTDAVFPVYVLHQTLIVLLAQGLLPLGWSPELEGPLLVLGTFVLSVAGYEAVRRVAWLRPCFGLASRPKDVSAAATGRTSTPPPACAAGTGGSSSTGSC